MTPAMMRALPANCVTVGTWPSISQAKAAANRISDMPTNEASFGPRERTAATAVMKPAAVERLPTASTGRIQLTGCPRNATFAVVAANGTTRAAPRSARAATATHIPAQLSTTGDSSAGRAADAAGAADSADAEAAGSDGAP